MSEVERLSAADAERRQRAMAAALARRGLGSGDRLGVVVPSSGAGMCLVLGALRTGIVPVVLSTVLTTEEQDALLADAEVAVTVRGWRELVALEESATSEAELAPVPLARPMLYTSGTTGTPKGVWTGVLTDDAAASLVQEERELWGFDAADVNLVCSPLHHSAPLRFASGTLLAGGDIAIIRRFDGPAMAQAVADHKPTSAFCVPTHLQRLAESGETPDLSSFRLLAHAGAPCPEPLKHWTIDAFPRGSVWEFYGATEGQFTACPADEWLDRPGTVGRARPGRRLSTDPDGVIWCSVPPYARFEYWRDPERTAVAWRGDAFSVGDVGRLDDDGYLFLDGRRDDLLISGGVNVYPAEVERVIEQLEGVREVAVFGIDDERWGQRVSVVVAGDVAPDAVLAHCRAHLAPYKCPKDVHVVDSLPRTPTGKVRRSTLAADLGLQSPRTRDGSSTDL